MIFVRQFLSIGKSELLSKLLNSRRKKLFRKIFKFYAVGLLAFFLELTLIIVFASQFGIEAYLTRFFSLPLASVVTWKLNREFTFTSKDPKLLRQYNFVLLNNLVGMAFNYGIFVGSLVFLADRGIPTEVLALLLASASTSVYNFVISNTLIFK